MPYADVNFTKYGLRISHMRMLVLPNTDLRAVICGLETHPPGCKYYVRTDVQQIRIWGISAFGDIRIWGTSAFREIRIWGNPHLATSAFGEIRIWRCPHLGRSVFGDFEVRIW